MARPTQHSNARPAHAGLHKPAKKNRIDSSDEGEQSDVPSRSDESESDEAIIPARKGKTASKPDHAKGKGNVNGSKRRVVDDSDGEEESASEQDSFDGGDSEEDSDSQNRVVTTKSGKSTGKTNNKAVPTVSAGGGGTKTSRASMDSKGAAASHTHHSTALPLQPLSSGAPQRERMSASRTVSLNDAHERDVQGAAGTAKRRLSGRGPRFSDLRRQSLPSNLRKSSLPGTGDASFADGESSFASMASSTSSPRHVKTQARTASDSSTVTGRANAVNQPPPQRRTSSGLALLNGGGGIGALNAANALKRNASNTSNGVGDLTSNASLPILTSISPEVMNTNYEEWMKMATDNKINSSNTWSFALIDYFHDMSLLRNADDEGTINFQKASCTLDGCVKIWTSRVDSVATETGKLLNGLSGDAAAAAQAEEDEDGDDDGDAEDGDGHPRPKRKKSARTHTTTLADSFSKIQVKDLELEFTVDPLFKKTSADFDEGGAAGLLMNHLSSDSNMRVVFDAGDAKIDDGCEVEGEEEEDDGLEDDEKLPTLDITKLKAKYLPDVRILDNMAICPSLSAFKFSSDATVLDMNLFNRTQLEASTSSVPFDAAEQHVNGNILDDLTMGNPLQGGATHDFFDEGGPMDFDGGDGGYDDDGGMGGGSFDDVEAGDGVPLDGEGEGYMAAQRGQATHLGAVQHFDPRMAPDQREVVIGMNGELEGGGNRQVFSYFDAALSKNWAGPEHWKMRRTIRRHQKDQEEEQTAEANANKPKRAAKDPFVINFSAETEAPESKKIFATSNASITLSGTKKRRTAVREAKDDHLLPDDKHFSSQQLLRLFLKPKAAINMRRRMQRAPRPEGEVDEHYWAAAAAAAQGAENANGDEEDDSGPILPFDTQFFHDDGDTPDYDEDLPMGGDDFEIPVTSSSHGVGTDEGTRKTGGEEEDLLASTQHTQVKRARPQFVNYAKKAKRVDVKKLKENIWKELALESAAREEEEDEDEAQEREGKQFTSVISGLQKVYPEEKMEEISTSFCFICLLHLANENGLRIESAGAKEVVSSDEPSTSTSVNDMDSTHRFVGGLDRLKIKREVVA